MNKKILILALLPLFTLAGCVTSSMAKPVNEPLQVIPPYEPPTPPEQPKNISSINILGIPDDYKIGMGLFDEANIRCEITYTDSSTYTFQLYEETLPYEIREMLGVEGEHTIKIQIRNQVVSFKVIMVDKGVRYVVRFLNYNDDILYQTMVMPNNKVHYNGEEPKRMSDVVNKFNYIGWDHDIETYLVDKSTDIYALYEPVYKVNDYLPIEQTAQFVTEYSGKLPVTNIDAHYACYYVGRITNFPVARFAGEEFKSHTQGHKEYIDYSFGMTDAPFSTDTSSPAYHFHPYIDWTMIDIIRKSYQYDEEEAASIDSRYLPASADLLNYDSFSTVPFELKSIRSRNSEGKTYNTAVNNFKNVITDYLSTDRIGTLGIPEDFPTGDYTASLFIDIDVYTYVYAENRPDEIKNSAIYVIPCISDIYIGVNDYENRVDRTYTSEIRTSTYDEDMMRVSMFAPMMKRAREAFED